MAVEEQEIESIKINGDLAAYFLRRMLELHALLQFREAGDFVFKGNNFSIHGKGV